jgi:hypothetical protein
MRGWDGAWPAELPAATVVKPAPAANPRPSEPMRMHAGAPEPASAELPRPGVPASAATNAELADRAPAAPPWPGALLPVEPALALEAPARDVARPRLEDLARTPRVESSASPAGVEPSAGPSHRESSASPPRADRSAALRIEHAAVPAARTVASSGLAAPLRAASQEHPMDPDADRASSRTAAPLPSVRMSPAAVPPPSARLSPAALHAAFQWVSGSPAGERSTAPAAPDPAPPASRTGPVARAEPPTVERPVASVGERAPANRRDALAPIVPPPERQAAPRTLHIGSIQVEIQTPRDAPDRDARPSQPGPAAPAGPLARGFTTPLGLRQG